MEIRQDWPLQKYNTFGVDVDCDFYAEAESKEDMLALLSDSRYAEMERFWLGGGSNTLFIGNFPGLVVRLCNKGMEMISEDAMRVELRVQAGEVWENFVSETVKRSWWGLENLSGIPGSVGGAAVQNMGAYGTEICEHIVRLEVFDTQNREFREMDVSQCEYSYRKSRFKGQDRYIVWSVVFRLEKLPRPELRYEALRRKIEAGGDFSQPAIVEAVLSMRKEKLPDYRQIGSVGSFFTNPVVSANEAERLQHSFPGIPMHPAGGGFKLSAAWLIEQCGWKGYREGDLGVYDRQPLVLVNYGLAQGEDVWDLACRIRESVHKKFWVDMEPEVCAVNGYARTEAKRYEEILQIMFHSLPMFQRIGAAAYKPDLSNTEKLMSALNHPYKRFKSIHVAGTNGKGSCSHLLASVLQSAGYKTGLYTSPHMRDFRERIRINGEMIPKEAVVEFYEAHEDLFRKVKASFFEMTVAMAFDYFARERVDIAVVEVGMGGRLDSTNVITPQLSLITNISLDHTQFLGDTLVKIADEKAGIIKPGVPVVISESQLQTRLVFERHAKEKQSRLLYADTVYSLDRVRSGDERMTFNILKYGSPYMTGMECDLGGDSYEDKNIVGVIAAIDVLRTNYDIPEAAIREGMATAARKTGLLGRWQCLSKNPSVYCDTGHNEAGIRLVIRQIAKMSYRSLHIVWGMVKDKDIDAVLRLLPQTATYYFCQARQERALPVSELCAKAESYGLKGKGYATVAEALAQARKQADPRDLIYVGGSTFVVAEIC